MTHYVYDGDDLVLQVDGAGNRIREYTYFPGIDRPHSMRQWANGAGGATFYYQTQRPGHVSGLVNTSNQLVNEYRYTPFGTPVNGYPVQGTPNPLQYMARELDALSGLYYVRNRWYDPQQGRFVSEDPIGLSGGVNRYAYVGNDPANATDPTGLCTYRGLSNDGRKIEVYIPDVTWGNAGGAPVQMFLSCSGMDWIYINKMNAVLVANYDVAWASMYGRSASGRGPSNTNSAPSMVDPSPVSGVATARCLGALGMLGVQAFSDWLFLTGVGTAASLALRGTIASTLGHGLAASTARIGVGSNLFMPVRAMVPEMLASGVILRAGAIDAGVGAVQGWGMGVVSSAAEGGVLEGSMIAEGVGIGNLGLADFVPVWAILDAAVTAAEVCSGG